MNEPTDQLAQIKNTQKTPFQPPLLLPAKVKASAYWNLLQSSIHHLDLCNLDRDGEQFAEQFIHQLLDKHQVQSELKATAQSSDLLKHLYCEAQNGLRLKGQSDLGFGFPLFVFQDANEPSRPIVAPLFIWSVQIVPSPNRINAWTIKCNEKSGLHPNYYLLKYLDQLQDKNLSEKYRKIVQNPPLNRSTLSGLCYDLIVQMELADQRSIREVLPLPTSKIVQNLAQKGTISWSGALSLFPPQNPSLIHEETFQLEELSDEETTEQALDHPFGLLNVDPYQKKALRFAIQFPLTLVDGIPGSGKTYALTNILTNALSNGRRCLIVSNHISTFQEIKHLLKDHHLDGLAFELLNRLEDGALLQNALVNAAKTLPQAGNDYNKDEFNLFLNKCKRRHQQLEENYKSLKVQNFGNNNWAETVGQFLRSGRDEGKELLRSQLNPNDFQFDFDEYELLKQAGH